MDFPEFPLAMPEPEDILLEEDKYDFLQNDEYKQKTHWIISACYKAADEGNLEMFAQTLALLSAYSFNLGVKFEKENKDA